MGNHAFSRMCYFCNNYDWFIGLIGWKVTVISSNFIALMLILNMAMNIHLTVRFLQLKKEHPEINKGEALQSPVKR